MDNDNAPRIFFSLLTPGFLIKKRLKLQFWAGWVKGAIVQPNGGDREKDDYRSPGE